MHNLFYSYYDSIFKDKNYRREVGECIGLYRRHCPLPLHSMIEIGCGTGNHTHEFRAIVPEITAIDIDPQILSIAKKKSALNGAVTFKRAEIHRINKKVPLIAALFNVICYIETFSALDTFFKGVGKNLESGGLFIFDAWNGIAAMRSMPQVKSTRHQAGDVTLTTVLTPVTDLFKQSVSLTYTVKEFRGARLKRRETFRFRHRLWTPREITECAEKHGLQQVCILRAGCTKRHAGEDDWKIMYVVKRI